MDAQVQRLTEKFCIESAVSFFCFLFSRSGQKCLTTTLIENCLCDGRPCSRDSDLLGIGFLIRNYLGFGIKIAWF